MKHIIITLNTPENIVIMQGYSSAEPIKQDDDFAIWYCTGLSQADIDAMPLIGMMLLNKPA